MNLAGSRGVQGAVSAALITQPTTTSELILFVVANGCRENFIQLRELQAGSAGKGPGTGTGTGSIWNAPPRDHCCSELPGCATKGWALGLPLSREGSLEKT